MVNINDLLKHAEERRARLEAGGFLPNQPVSDDPAIAQRTGESDDEYMERLERDHPETVRELQMRFMGYAGQVSDAVRDLFSRTYGTLTLPGVGTFAKLSSGKVGISIADLLGSALQTGALNQMTDAINGVGSAARQAINAGSLAQFAQINETITQAAAAALAAYSPFNDPEFRRQMEETFRQRRDQDSRGYDYSEHHLAPDHPAVTQLMAALDYGAFLDAQEPTGPDHERLIADIRSAIADPEGDMLRRGIAHELARRVWANASTGWDYRGDDDPEPDIAELVNTETGEPLELPVTGEFITDIATGEIDRMAAGLDQYNGGDRWPTWRNFRDILTAQSERDVLEGIWAGYLDSTKRVRLAQMESGRTADSTGNLHVYSGAFTGAVWRALNDGATRLDPDPDRSNYPTRRVRGSNIDARMTVEHDTIAQAWQSALHIGPAAADAFIVFTSAFLQARQRPLLPDYPDLYDGYLSLDDMLRISGYHKKKRAWDPDDRKTVAHGVETLGRLRINGFHKIHVKGKVVRVPLRDNIVRTAMIPRLVTPDEEDRFLANGPEWNGDIDPANVAGWAFQLGPWADDLRQGGPTTGWLAHVMSPILGYTKTHQRYPRRLGFVFALSFRERAYKRDYGKPWPIRDLLETAGLEITKGKERHAVKLFAEGLELLTRDGVIERAAYADGRPITDQPPSTGRYWLAAWLDERIIVTPPASIRETYSRIGDRKPAKQRAIASQNVTK